MALGWKTPWGWQIGQTDKEEQAPSPEELQAAKDFEPYVEQARKEIGEYKPSTLQKIGDFPLTKVSPLGMVSAAKQLPVYDELMGETREQHEHKVQERALALQQEDVGRKYWDGYTSTINAKMLLIDPDDPEFDVDALLDELEGVDRPDGYPMPEDYVDPLPGLREEVQVYKTQQAEVTLRYGTIQEALYSFYDSEETPNYIPTEEEVLAKLEDEGTLGALTDIEQEYLTDQISSLRGTRTAAIEAILAGPDPWANAMKLQEADAWNIVGRTPEGEAVYVEGLPETEPAPIVPDNQELKEQIAIWEEALAYAGSALTDEELSDLLPKMSMKEKIWDEGLLRLPQHVFNGIDWYVKNVVHTVPTAINIATYGSANLLTMGHGEDVAPFSADIWNDTKRKFQERNFAGILELDNVWRANLDNVPGWDQFLVDVMCDPANIIGMGALVKLGNSSATKVPAVGRLLKWGGEAEQLYIRGSEWPAKAMGRAMMKAKHVTPFQYGMRKRWETMGTVESVAHNAKYLRKPSSHMTKKDWGRMLEHVRHATPAARTPGVYALKQLLIEPKALVMDDLKKLCHATNTSFDALASTYTGGFLGAKKAQKLGELDDIIREAAFNPKAMDQAADRLVIAVGGDGSAQAHQQALQWLQKKIQRDWDEVTRPITGAADDAWGASLADELTRTVQRRYVSNARAPQYMAKIHGATMGAFIHSTVGRAQQSAWRAMLERKLIMPMAESNLVFGTYGLFNMAEGHLKQLMSGIGMGMSRRENYSWQHLKNMSYEVRRMVREASTPGASQGITSYGDMGIRGVRGRRMQQLFDTMPQWMQKRVTFFEELGAPIQMRGDWVIFPWTERIPFVGKPIATGRNVVHNALITRPGQYDTMARLYAYNQFMHKRLDQVLVAGGWGTHPVEAKVTGMIADYQKSILNKDKKLRTRIAQSIEAEISHLDNPAVAKRLKKRWSVGEAKAWECNEIANKYMSEMDAVDIEMWRRLAPEALEDTTYTRMMGEAGKDAIDDLRLTMRDWVTRRSLMQPEQVISDFRNWTDEFVKVEFKTKEEVAAAYQYVVAMESALEGVPHRMSSAAVEMGRLHPKSKENFADLARVNIESTLDATTPMIIQMEEHLNAAMAKMGMSNTASSVWTKRIQAMADARAESAAVTTRYRGAGEAWAGDRANDLNQVWSKYRQTQASLKADFEAEVANMARQLGEPVAPVVPVNVGGKNLSPEEFANLLFDCQAEGLTRGIFESSHLMDRASFISYAKRVATNKQVKGIKATTYGEVYDQLLHSVRWQGEVGSHLAIQLRSIDDAVMELRKVKMSPKLGEDAIAEVHKLIDDVSGEIGTLRKTDPKRLQSRLDMEEEAAKLANDDYNIAFFGRDKDTVADDFMRGIFPYWTYASHRAQWTFDQVLKHPGIMSTIGKWHNASEQGYVRVGPWDAMINPLRGTIFMGGWRGWWRKDYPEHYDSGFGGMVAEVNDMLSRVGLYPNVLVQAIPPTTHATHYGGGVDMGAMLPTPLQSVLDTAVALGIPGAKDLRTEVFNDPFLEYYIGLNLMTQGFDPSEVKRHLEDGTATPEEEKAWSKAVQDTSKFNLWSQQTGLLKMAPKELEKHQQTVAEIIAYYTGISPEQQKELKDAGYRISDVAYIPKEARAVIDLLPFSGSATSVLQPEGWQQVLDDQARAWDKIEDEVWNPRYEEQLTDDELFVEGGPGVFNWIDRMRMRRSESFNKQQGMIDAYDLPMTQEEMSQLYEQFGMAVPAFNPEKYIIEQYYTIQPEELVDPVSGKLYTDWETYWRRREGFMSIMPDDLRVKFEDYLDRRRTPLEKMFEEVSTTQLKPYWNLSSSVIEVLPDEHKSIIALWKMASTPEDKARYEAITFRGETLTGEPQMLSIVGNYNSMVRRARQAYRKAHPTTDYFLYRWGYVTKVVTPEAQSIVEGYGWDIPGLEPVESWSGTLEEHIKEFTLSSLPQELKNVIAEET